MRTPILLYTALALGAVNHIFAAPPQLRAPVALQAASGNLAPGTFAIPIPADWNGDGLKDLIIGYQSASKIAVYTNSGSDSAPVFTTGYNLQFNTRSNVLADINHPSGGCGAPAPWVVDFDDDGRRDLIVGAGHDGSVWFYRNTNTDAQPILEAPSQLRTASGILEVQSRAVPTVVDWDEDGLKDILCGSGNGYIFIFRNTNSTANPIFAPGEKILAGGTNLFLNVQLDGLIDGVPRSVARLCDWDNDGLRDLVCSSDTGVFWCRNTNANTTPSFDAPVRLIAPGTNGLQPIITDKVPGARMRVFVVDWNNDGVQDILLGNAKGTSFFYEGYSFGLKSTKNRGVDGIVLQWSSTDGLNYNVLAGPSPDNVREPLITNWPSGGRVTSWTNTAIAGQCGFYRVETAR